MLFPASQDFCLPHSPVTAPKAMSPESVDRPQIS
jgi:hypothetical protein